MSHSDIVFLSGIAWLVVGFFIGRHYHALKVREIQERRIKNMALDWVLWRAAVTELRGSDIGEIVCDVFGEQVVVLANPKKMLERARN